VILFLWRACNDILPTKENLCKRRIVDDPICPMCGQESESTIHALWSCVAAKAVWTECPARIQKCQVMNTGFMDLFRCLISRLELEEVELVVMVAQKIWFRRNRMVFEREGVHPKCSMKCAVDDLTDFRKSTAKISLSSDHRSPSSPCQWARPVGDLIKLNWDSAVQTWRKLVGIGVVARNSTGQVLASLCSVQRYISDSTVAEAYGARLAVEFGIFLGLRSIILEGDASEIIQALRSSDSVLGKFGSLISDAQNLLSSFGFYACTHVRREGNRVAHTLAKFAISSEHNKVWFQSYQTCLSGLVNSELSVPVF